MARSRLPLPFGSGLDRESGLGVVAPASMADLRNVHVGEGKVRLRRGMEAQVVFAGEDAVIGLFPLRSRGIGVAITYRTATREVRLWRVASDGQSGAVVGVVWTLDATASFPRVSAADSGGKL
jgi:hypothetical protein